MMRSCTRKLLTVLLLAAAFTLVTPAALGKEVTIRIAHWLGDPDHGSGLEMLMKAVEERIAPYGIKLETVVNSSANYRDRVISQTIGGMGPDVVFALPYDQFGVQALLMDLTPFLESDPELNFDSFLPGIWNMFSYLDSTKLLPVGISPYLMFYNKQHFLEAGVAFPDETWRWSVEIPDALVKLRRTAADGSVTRYGLLLENRLWTLFFSQGGEVLNEDGTAAALENPAVYELFEQVYRWRQDDLIPAYANHRPTFAANRGAMHGVMGTFALPYYVEHATDIDWSFTLPPQGAAGLQIDENVNGWGISQFTQHPEEAWIVLKALADVSGEITMEALGHFSPVKGKMDGDTVAYLQDRFGLTLQEIDIAFEAINYVRPRFRHPKMDEITPIVQRVFNRVAWQGHEPGTAFASAAEEINGILRQN